MSSTTGAVAVELAGPHDRFFTTPAARRANAAKVREARPLVDKVRPGDLVTVLVRSRTYGQLLHCDVPVTQVVRGFNYAGGGGYVSGVQHLVVRFVGVDSAFLGDTTFREFFGVEEGQEVKVRPSRVWGVTFGMRLAG
jgi:hypothetical protein